MVNMKSAIGLLTINLLLLFTDLILCDEIVYKINTKKSNHVISDKFISYTINPTELLKALSYELTSPSTVNMIKALSPLYIRFGGPDTNKYVFRRKSIDERSNETFVISDMDWNLINKFAKSMGIDVVVCLNDRHHPNGHWDSRNSLELISYSDSQGYNLTWQLGYEVQRTKEEVSPSQLGKDVERLRTILDSFPRYKNSMIIGPDVKSVHRREDADFYRDYFVGAGPYTDVITWHPRVSPASKFQITSDSSEQEENEFPADYLEYDRMQLNKLLAKSYVRKPVWIAEPKIETKGTFLDGLLWARRLGLASRSGVEVVMRQPEISHLISPKPEYWIALFHKKLLGQSVLDSKSATNTSEVLLFSHCTNTHLVNDRSSKKLYEEGALSLFAVNLAGVTKRVAIRNGRVGIGGRIIHEFILSSGGKHPESLQTHETYLNGEPLEMTENGHLPRLSPRKIKKYDRDIIVKMPPYSVGFWVVPGAEVRACQVQGVPNNASPQSTGLKSHSLEKVDEISIGKVQSTKEEVKATTKSVESEKNKIEGENRSSCEDAEREKRSISEETSEEEEETETVQPSTTENTTVSKRRKEEVKHHEKNILVKKQKKVKENAAEERLEEDKTKEESNKHHITPLKHIRMTKTARNVRGAKHHEKTEQEEQEVAEKLDNDDEDVVKKWKEAIDDMDEELDPDNKENKNKAKNKNEKVQKKTSEEKIKSLIDNLWQKYQTEKKKNSLKAHPVITFHMDETDGDGVRRRRQHHVAKDKEELSSVTVTDKVEPRRNIVRKIKKDNDKGADEGNKKEDGKKMVVKSRKVWKLKSKDEQETTEIPTTVATRTTVTEDSDELEESTEDNTIESFETSTTSPSPDETTVPIVVVDKEVTLEDIEKEMADSELENDKKIKKDVNNFVKKEDFEKEKIFEKFEDLIRKYTEERQGENNEEDEEKDWYEGNVQKIKPRGDDKYPILKKIKMILEEEKAKRKKKVSGTNEEMKMEESIEIPAFFEEKNKIMRQKRDYDDDDGEDEFEAIKNRLKKKKIEGSPESTGIDTSQMLRLAGATIEVAADKLLPEGGTITGQHVKGLGIPEYFELFGKMVDRVKERKNAAKTMEEEDNDIREKRNIVEERGRRIEKGDRTDEKKENRLQNRLKRSYYYPQPPNQQILQGGNVYERKSFPDSNYDDVLIRVPYKMLRGSQEPRPMWEPRGPERFMPRPYMVNTIEEPARKIIAPIFETPKTTKMDANAIRQLLEDEEVKNLITQYMKTLDLEKNNPAVEVPAETTASTVESSPKEDDVVKNTKLNPNTKWFYTESQEDGRSNMPEETLPKELVDWMKTKDKLKKYGRELEKIKRELASDSGDKYYQNTWQTYPQYDVQEPVSRYHNRGRWDSYNDDVTPYNQMMQPDLVPQYPRSRAAEKRLRYFKPEDVYYPPNYYVQPNSNSMLPPLAMDDDSGSRKMKYYRSIGAIDTGKNDVKKTDCKDCLDEIEHFLEEEETMDKKTEDEKHKNQGLDQSKKDGDTPEEAQKTIVGTSEHRERSKRSIADKYNENSIKKFVSPYKRYPVKSNTYSNYEHVVPMVLDDVDSELLKKSPGVSLQDENRLEIDKNNNLILKLTKESEEIERSIPRNIIDNKTSTRDSANKLMKKLDSSIAKLKTGQRDLSARTLTTKFGEQLLKSLAGAYQVVVELVKKVSHFDMK